MSAFKKNNSIRTGLKRYEDEKMIEYSFHSSSEAQTYRKK